MKRILALAVVLTFSLSANAQIDFGLRAGANFTDMNLKDFGNAQFYDDLSNGGPFL